MSTECPVEPTPRHAFRGGRRLALLIGGAVVVWFAASEFGTRFWYASHEAKLPRNPPLPDGPTLVQRIDSFAARSSGVKPSEQEIGAAAMEMLKCSFGKMVIWPSEQGPMAATVLRWSDRSVVGGVESMHNPGNCLKAAGWAVAERRDLGFENFRGAGAEVTGWAVSRPGLKMWAFSAVFRRFTETPKSDGATFWNSKRLESVLEGRRDAPQLIVLGYVPASTSVEDAHARFSEILRAALGEDSKP